MPSDATASIVALIWSSPAPNSVVTGCCIISTNGRAGSIRAPTPPSWLSASRPQAEVGLGDEVDRRAAHVEHHRRVLAHRDDPPRAQLRGREVDVGHLRHRVAHALVDRAGHLAALRVGDGDVHVRRGDRGGDRLEAVGDGDDDVRAQHLEHRRQLEQPQPGRLGHRRRVLALDDQPDRRVGREAVHGHDVDGVAEPLEHRRGARDDLQLEVGMGLAPRRART